MATAPPPPLPSVRDLRLDLVRGITMLIIFVAHVPNNLWADYIPARMGFSSGAEIFVLCSGIASGLAFGGAFVRKGFGEGFRRILRRIGQLYAAHLGLIIGLGGLALGVDFWMGSSLLAVRYDLQPFVDTPVAALVGYFTLAYVPAFFDILPLYIVLLGLVPIVMLWARHPGRIFAASVTLWLTVLATRFNLPNGTVGAVWYFNPFAWQFLFLLGFGWGRGWWPAPKPNMPWLVMVALLYVVVAFPLNFWAINDGSRPTLELVQDAIYPHDAITVLHPTRLLHVLALGYLTLCALEPIKHKLHHAMLRPLIAVGQNSFATFLAGLALSMLGGIVIDQLGRGALAATAINGFGLIILSCFGMRLQQRPAVTSLQKSVDFSLPKLQSDAA